jgi:hypothetical protein
MSAMPPKYLAVVTPLVDKAREILESGESLQPFAFIGNFETGRILPVLLDTRDDRAKDGSAAAIRLAAEQTQAHFVFTIMEAWALPKDKLHRHGEIVRNTARSVPALTASTPRPSSWRPPTAPGSPRPPQAKGLLQEETDLWAGRLYVRGSAGRAVRWAVGGACRWRSASLTVTPDSPALIPGYETADAPSSPRCSRPPQPAPAAGDGRLIR